MEVTQKDYGYDITFTIKDADGIAVDISATTARKFVVVEVDTNRNIIDGACPLTGGGADGKCKYTVQEEDFAKYGNYRGAIQLQWAGKVLTTKTFFITVNKKMSL